MPETASEPISGALLAGVVSEWQKGTERLAKLRAGYENERAINKRARQPGKPNNRLAHGFAKYIATMSSGYMVGKPVAYAAPESQEKALQMITDEYKRANVDSVDIELARYAAIYGKAVQIVYADEDAKARVAAISPETAFVVYDDTVESKPLFGVQVVKTTVSP
jgi:SPP1 family phage portal protein